MLTAVLFVGALCLTAAPASSPDQKPVAPLNAVGSAELTDPAGDVQNISTSRGSVPGFDVVKLALASDGTSLTITATLAKPPSGTFASDVVKLYIDTDNNPATGYSTFWGKKPGFELKGELNLCIDYDNGGSACSGGMDAKVKRYYSSLQVGKIIDTSSNTQRLFAPFKEPTGNVQGAVLSVPIAYKDLGVKPGQTIRIVASESAGAYDETSEFRPVVLKLK